MTSAPISSINRIGHLSYAPTSIVLRVIAMIIIISHYFAVHGSSKFPTKTITTNSLWIRYIQLEGKIGVDVFALISGYFLVTCHTLK